MRRQILLLLLVGRCKGFQTPATRSLAKKLTRTTTTTTTTTSLNVVVEDAIISTFATTSTIMDTLHSTTSPLLSLANDVPSFLIIDGDTAEQWAGPFFGASLFPYLAFLYFLNVQENDTPKGVTVGFVTCLLFVFLTIPAAIAAKLLYGVSLADSDWLHGSAESLLTVTNLVTVIAFRQALGAKESNLANMPASAQSYAPMTALVAILTALAAVTAFVPAINNPEVHTLYLNGFLDLPFSMDSIFGAANPEPANALSVPCWIIHVSSLVEFLVAMGFCWRWGDVVNNPKWKGLTWGLLPLHSSGITACTYHLFYNQIPILVPLQALLTCVGNTTAAYAALRIAISNGWRPPSVADPLLEALGMGEDTDLNAKSQQQQQEESQSLIGFEDLGNALAGDNDYSFLFKLFAGCAVASYIIKYGETFFEFPYEANVYLGFAVIGVPSALNAFKWYKRSQDPSFEGWF